MFAVNGWRSAVLSQKGGAVTSGFCQSAKDSQVFFVDDFDVIETAVNEVDGVTQVVHKHGTAGFCQRMALMFSFFKYI